MPERPPFQIPAIPDTMESLKAASVKLNQLAESVEENDSSTETGLRRKSVTFAKTGSNVEEDFVKHSSSSNLNNVNLKIYI